MRHARLRVGHWRLCFVDEKPYVRNSISLARSKGSAFVVYSDVWIGWWQFHDRADFCTRKRFTRFALTESKRVTPRDRSSCLSWWPTKLAKSYSSYSLAFKYIGLQSFQTNRLCRWPSSVPVDSYTSPRRGPFKQNAFLWLCLLKRSSKNLTHRQSCLGFFMALYCCQHEAFPMPWTRVCFDERERQTEIETERDRETET